MTQPATNQPTPADQKKKPWYKKWWGIAIIVVLAISVIGAIMELVEKPTAVPDVVGMPAAQAKTTLKDAGFTSVKVNKEDGSRLVIVNDDWDVIASDPAAGTEVKKSAEIILTASDERAQAEKQKQAEEKEAAKEAEQKEKESAETEDEPEASLSPSIAQATCERYAQQLTDEKLKFHWLAGKIAEETRDDGTIFFKVEVTGKNAAGAKHEYVVECYVGGTNEAPEMVDFISY